MEKTTQIETETKLKTIAIKLDLTFRIFVLAFALTAGVLFLFAGTKAANAANLKASSVVQDSVLTLSDLFDGVPEGKADYVLGAAPAAGQNMVIDARTLLRVALALDLSWRPQSNLDQITVRREATVIDTQRIKSEISETLKAEGLDGKFHIVFNTENPEIIMPSNKPETFDITNFNFDATRNVFQARILAPSKESPFSELRLSGHIERLIPVPVLKDTIRQGEVIRASDILWVDMRDRDVQHDIMLSDKDLVGMTPRRMIMAGKPVRSPDISLPQVIKRGDTVTIMYRTGPILLTAEGKALENGSKDDIIRVVNTDSSRPVEGIVTAEGTILIN